MRDHTQFSCANPKNAMKRFIKMVDFNLHCKECN